MGSRLKAIDWGYYKPIVWFVGVFSTLFVSIFSLNAYPTTGTNAIINGTSIADRTIQFLISPFNPVEDIRGGWGPIILFIFLFLITILLDCVYRNIVAERRKTMRSRIQTVLNLRNAILVGIVTTYFVAFGQVFDGKSVPGGISLVVMVISMYMFYLLFAMAFSAICYLIKKPLYKINAPLIGVLGILVVYAAAIFVSSTILFFFPLGSPSPNLIDLFANSPHFVGSIVAGGLFLVYYVEGFKLSND